MNSVMEKGKRKSIICIKCGKKFSAKPYFKTYYRSDIYPSKCKNCKPTLIGA